MTPDEYIADLAEDRGLAIEAVRETILANLPEGYEETFAWGMLAYVVPLERYPVTYNKQPLQYAALGSQNRYMAGTNKSDYSSEDRAATFRTRYKATGKRLDMGKSCVRFKTLDDLPLDLIAEEIASTSVDDFIALYESTRAGR
jgi:hypothetical protein